MIRRSCRRLCPPPGAPSYYYYQQQQQPSHGGGGGSSGYSSSLQQQLMSSPMQMMAAQQAQRVQLDPSSFIERAPRNTLLNIVPQGKVYVVERFGKYHTTLSPGLWFVLPVIDRIRYCYTTKEQGISIPNQAAITRDNVIVEIDGVLFLRIVDAERASYNIENPIYNLINLAQTTMRSEIGKLKLDALFEERANLNLSIVDAIKSEAWGWGVECKRYEIRDIQVSDIVRQSMDLQAEAERRKRKLILDSEGESLAETNRAQGRRSAEQQMAEAAKFAVERNAEASALSMKMIAEATAESIRIVGKALADVPNSSDAVSLRIAEKYIDEFGKLAKQGNSVVMSSNVSDPAAFSAQALSIYNTLTKTTPTHQTNLPSLSLPQQTSSKPQ